MMTVDPVPSRRDARQRVLLLIQELYYEKATDHEMKVELGLVLRDWAAEALPESKCRHCGHAVVFVPDDRPRFEGHVYTEDGVREWQRHSRYCEWCFDKLMLEPDDRRRAEWFGEEVSDADPEDPEGR